jgi:4-oxalocrotonate tautomerase
MPVATISTWKMQDEEKVKAMLEEVTHAIHKNTGAPLDKISVIISEIEPSRWADAGVPGDAIDFQTKSRRKTYEE